MGLLKFLVWTGCAVGLGVFLATVEVKGHTPVEYVQRAWKRQAPASRVERVSSSLREALDDAEDTVKRTSKQALPVGPPRERITHEDRAAIERIIAQKK